MRVGLFVTCLVDVYRPNVGFSAVELLERAGYEVEVPGGQTCCGQPAYNSGDREDARRIARQVIGLFEDVPYVVVPSGSCAGMLKLHYPRLFEHDPRWRERAEALAGRVYELSAFLVEVAGMADVGASYAGSCTYHDSCSAQRELGVREQPRQLLASVQGLELRELEDGEVCCGFGGTFCVKYPQISERMVADKVAAVEASGAELLLAGDLGCLLNIAGRLKREGSTVRAYHVAEVLAGRSDVPGIGDGEEA